LQPCKNLYPEIMEYPCLVLSEKEIEFIRRDIRTCGISFSHLEEELVDHICCIVEDYLESGYSFENAYRKVKKNVAFDTLKDLEIQTLLLINKKLQTMKTTLRISGIAGLLAILAASLFKIFHWQGGNVILTLGIATIALGYIPVLVLTMKREKILKRRRNITFVGIITAFCFLVSLLFAIMHWPYTEYTIYFTWIMAFVFLIILFASVIKSDDNRLLHLSLILFLTILFILDVSMYFVNLNNPKTSTYTMESNLEASIQLLDHRTDEYYSEIDSIENNPEYQDIINLRSQTGEIISKIEDMQHRIFASKEEKEIYSRKLFDKHSNLDPLEADAKKLENNLDQYRVFLVGRAELNPDLQVFIEKSIKFGSFEFNNALPIIYNNLGKLIRDIKMAECELLNDLLQ
jgi:hypothetical protein